MKTNANKLIGFINNLNKLNKDKFIKETTKKEIIFIKTDKGFKKVGKYE